MKKVCVLTLALSPPTAASFALGWLTSKSGVEWAYALFNTDNVLNFGGNPAEVYSHLLNWIVMTGSVASLCTVWFASLKTRTDADRSSGRDFFPVAIFLLSVLGLVSWAGYLDSRSGEGTVVMSFVFFFGPGVTLLFVAAGRLLACGARSIFPKLAVGGLFVLSLVLQWFYQPSPTGGPNVLVLPLLGGQVAAFWILVAGFRRRQVSRSTSVSSE